MHSEYYYYKTRANQNNFLLINSQPIEHYQGNDINNSTYSFFEERTSLISCEQNDLINLDEVSSLEQIIVNIQEDYEQQDILFEGDYCDYKIENEILPSERFEVEISDFIDNILEQQEYNDMNQTFKFNKQCLFAKNIFEGILLPSQNEVVSRIYSFNDIKFKRFIYAQFIIENNYLEDYFVIAKEFMRSESYSGSYTLAEIAPNIEKKDVQLVLLNQMSGSIQDFILLRKQSNKQFSPELVVSIIKRLCQIAIEMSNYNLYHSNLALTKFMMIFDSKNVKEDQNIKIDVNDIKLSDLANLHILQDIQKPFDFNDTFSTPSDIITYNGFHSMESQSFTEKIYPLRQNAFTIGIIGLSLITLNLFDYFNFASQFELSTIKLKYLLNQPQFNKIGRVLFGLLEKNQDTRLTAKQAFDQLNNDNYFSENSKENIYSKQYYFDCNNSDYSYNFIPTIDYFDI